MQRILKIVCPSKWTYNGMYSEMGVAVAIACYVLFMKNERKYEGKEWKRIKCQRYQCKKETTLII